MSGHLSRKENQNKEYRKEWCFQLRDEYHITWIQLSSRAISLFYRLSVFWLSGFAFWDELSYKGCDLYDLHDFHFQHMRGPRGREWTRNASYRELPNDWDEPKRHELLVYNSGKGRCQNIIVDFVQSVRCFPFPRTAINQSLPFSESRSELCQNGMVCSWLGLPKATETNSQCLSNDRQKLHLFYFQTISWASFVVNCVLLITLRWSLCSREFTKRLFRGLFLRDWRFIWS
jgi:hypothetical protein